MAKRKGQILDLAMAVAAAGSVAFATWAMPADLFTDIVWRSRIDMLIPAATPPFGETARMLASATAAALMFGLVFALMRALGKPRKRRPIAAASAEPPRIRKADAHPDAPARRPLFAGTDLGEPLDEIPVDESYDDASLDLTPHIEPDVKPLPSFLVDQPPEESDEQPDQGTDEPSAEGGSLASLAARLPEANVDTDASIGELMERFEAGAASFRGQPQAAEMPAEPEIIPDEPAPPVAAEEVLVPEEIGDVDTTDPWAQLTDALADMPSHNEPEPTSSHYEPAPQPMSFEEETTREPIAFDAESAPEPIALDGQPTSEPVSLEEEPAQEVASAPEPQPESQPVQRSPLQQQGETQEEVDAKLRSAIRDLRRIARG